MPYDLQSMLSLFGFPGAPAGATPAAAGAMPPQNQSQPTAPASGTPTPPPTGLQGLFGGGPGQIGPTALINAGAQMMQGASQPGGSLGGALGQGLSGFITGQQLDRTNFQNQQGLDRTAALQAQQQAALNSIADRLSKMSTGAQPAAAVGGGAQPPVPGGIANAQASALPVMTPPPPPAPPGVPGAAPAPGPAPSPFQFGTPNMSNPYLQMMMQKRFGQVA